MKKNLFPLFIGLLILSLAQFACALQSPFVLDDNPPMANAPSSADAQPTAENTTPCAEWNTAAKATNMLLPGFSARGDVVANDVVYFDSGSGEGTTIINNSNQAIKIYAEWGSGCEPFTDLKTLVNKDLAVGCGDNDNDGVGDGCKKARIVTFEDGDPAQKFYTEPIQ